MTAVHAPLSRRYRFWRSGRSPRRISAIVITLGALVPFLATGVSGTVASAFAAEPGQGSTVYPTPQSTKHRGEVVRIPETVTVVAGAATDASALDVVRDVLMAAGVRRINQVDDRDTSSAELAVYVGGRSENAATAAALDALGVKGAEGIAVEGYVFAAGTGGDGHSRIVLDGVDASGTFYAAQTFRQLVRKSPETASVRGVEIRDWPSLRWRGVVEGFYGPPFSHETRLSDFDYYGRHKMNTYVYTPKDDPYLRAEWRRPHPAAALDKLGELVTKAKTDHVEFNYVLSPGLSICYSRASETDALMAKFESLWTIGVRSFIVAFDDIDYQRWNCEEDRSTYGAGAAAAATAQAHVVNRVQREFVATHAGALPLQVVPTEYWATTRTDYKSKIADVVDPKVVVQWTGIDVIAPTISRADVAAARDVFRHRILIWDNYPVNDYVQGRLLLGPFVGREPGLGASIIGLTANPMPQAHASKTSLFTVADYTWNDAGYRPAKSWAAGLAELAGGDARTAAALRTFADLNYSSRLDQTVSPQLSAELATFWPAWSTGQTTAAAALRDYLGQVYDAPEVLRSRLDNPGFIADTEPWLDATRAWGKAALTALDMLVAQRANRGAQAWADRQALPGLVAKAKSFTWVGLDPDRPVKVEIDPTLERFVKDALAENGRWLGVKVVPSGLTPITNLPLLDDRFPFSNMVDGNPETYFWGAATAQPGTFVGVDFGTVRPVNGIDVLMSKSDSPDDYIHGGVVEWSTDGTNWTTGQAFSGQPELKVDLPAGTAARYVRLLATQSQPNWVVVREFSVLFGDVATVSGAPEPADGGQFVRAADANLGTAYQASRAPTAGEALTLTLPAARPLSQVVVLQPGTAFAGGEVQVQTGGRWIGIGPLAGGYTGLPAKGVSATAIKLVWAAGSTPPAVTEILPWYADVPLADVAVSPASLSVDTGGEGTATVEVTATRLDSPKVTVEAAAPAGVTVTPSRSSFVLSRGAKVSLPLNVMAAANLASGTYQVPVTVHGDGQKVTATLAVVVWPPTTNTNVALASNGGVATASAVEDHLPQFTADKAVDGDTSTRWSSPWSDDQWLQVQLAQPHRVGKVVLRWEAAHASSYEILTSADGITSTTSATESASEGGTESIRLDAADTRYVRMRGLTRATGFGYSVYEFEVYPVA